MSGELDFVEEERAFALRDYQVACLDAVRAGWKTNSRQLVDMATGTGKSSVFSAVAKEEVEAGGRVLVLANRENLVQQGANRIANETGLDVDIEMADSHASLGASVVMASVQTIQSNRRLLGFPHDHFSLVVGDESHHSLAPSWQKPLNYFHFGEQSLDESWTLPVPGVPTKYHARVLGVTATPDIGTKKSLGEWFQSVAFRYSYSQAVIDGWLVPPIAKSVPLEIDIRGLRPGRTSNGSDFSDGELSERLIPVIEALAKQLRGLAPDRKTIAFLPSIECSKLLAAAVTRLGMNGIFVSGECRDVEEKTNAFRRAGPGAVLCNAALYVEGSDFPDVSCVAPFRATQVTSFYRQLCGRACRVLPGIVDGLPTPQLRRMAIAASAKPDMLILDPLWRSELHTLCSHYDLVTNKPEIKARMAAMPGMGIIEAEKQAERDMLAALEKEAKKHAKKQGRTINPLTWSIIVGDEDLAQFEPETAWDELPATKPQLDFIAKQQIDTTGIKFRGHANRIIVKIVTRFKDKLATWPQVQLMLRLGIPEDDAASMTQSQATTTIDATLAAKRARD